MPAKIQVDPIELAEDLKYNQIGIVAKKYGCHPHTINVWAKKYGITYIIRRGFNDVNHYFFDEWSSPMAYILGFITADGNVHGSRPYLNIEVKRSDDIVLKYILKNIQPSANIFYYNHLDKRSGKTYKAAKIAIYSSHIKEKLKNYSIFPNKTGKHRIDFKIPEEFKWDYIRGFLDGDGCIHHKSGRINIAFACQSLEFLKDLESLIGVEGNITTNSKPPTLKYFAKNSLLIRDYIYNNECFCLLRKKEIAYKYNDKDLPYVWSDEENLTAYNIVISGGRGSAVKEILPHITREQAHSKVGKILKEIKCEKNLLTVNCLTI